ncbi:hypothetical protein NC653_004961 [Populus alba x Populus x berolinensis]|uniref:Uncharacterized protein n=1 Tax=Populus alba x Populus x berolinensis TaxID=444605 RepID=A0AAD6RAQ0_9ROSI|nr:hypothetical protein NC653_004956 [Populus alba x Populus x berolinensis]KAJ7005503.1 hypothetical protein NC653_004961 [Populus alba x Populus x berolinensis]
MKEEKLNPIEYKFDRFMREPFKDCCSCQDTVTVECSELKILLCFWFFLACASCFIERSTICSGTKPIWCAVRILRSAGFGCALEVVTESSCLSALSCSVM